MRLVNRLYVQLFIFFGAANIVAICLSIATYQSYLNEYQKSINWQEIFSIGFHQYTKVGLMDFKTWSDNIQKEKKITINVFKNNQLVFDGKNHLLKPTETKSSATGKNDLYNAIQNNLYDDSKKPVLNDNLQTIYPVHAVIANFDFKNEHYQLVGFPNSVKSSTKFFTIISIQIILSLFILSFISHYASKKVSNPLYQIKNLASNLHHSLELNYNTTRSDIYEINELEQTMIQMAQDLKSVVNEQKELLWNISHELRSPLNRIGFAVELIQESKGNSPSKYIENIKKDIVILENIIKETILLARIDADVNSFKNKVDINEIVSEAIDTFKILSKGKNISLVKNFSKHHFFIFGHSFWIKQAVSNLIDNAIKFTPENGKIEVLLKKEGQHIIVEVIDNGPGIGKEKQEKLVQPFFRNVKESQGFGLGLSIVQKIAKNHNGYFSIQNGVNSGCIAKLTLNEAY